MSAAPKAAPPREPWRTHSNRPSRRLISPRIAPARCKWCLFHVKQRPSWTCSSSTCCGCAASQPDRALNASQCLDPACRGLAATAVARAGRQMLDRSRLRRRLSRAGDCLRACGPDRGHGAFGGKHRQKAAFLREAVNLLQVPAVIHAVRIEDFGKNFAMRPDVVTARALAPLDELLKLAQPLLKTSAQGLFPKGQDVEGELTKASKYWTIDAELVRARPVRRAAS